MIAKIDKVFHVSDIHVRILQRHDEYSEIFDKLIGYIEAHKTKDSVIVITGDVAHSKVDMSSEMTMLIGTLFRKFADICPTIVIPGNHDFNGINSSRLDVLTPICDIMRHPNLYYLPYSGVFEIGDIAFGVFSILDGKEKWPFTINTSCSTKVALFHGPVNGASNDYGYLFDNASVDVEMFTEYDIVMLGDIHKFQYVSPTAAYPGSLIQQNFGEGLDHGIIVWDIPTKKGEFVKIPQEHLYITINDINTEIPEYDAKRLTVRIRHNDEDPKSIKSFIDRLSKKYTVNVASIENVGSVSTSELLHVLTTKHADESSILREYLDIKGLSSESVEAIIALHTEIKNKAVVDDSVRNVDWDIEYFAFDNMFSYGPGNVVNFSRFNGLVGLFAPNATGKSTLIDAILFCMYDKCSKTSMAANVMNRNADYFTCELILRISGVRYKIVRNGSKSKLGKVSVDVYFYIIDDEGNVIKDLTGTKREHTNKIIRSYIGTYDDITLTSISTQKNSSTFIDKTQSNRQTLLYRFLDTEIYETYENLGKAQLKNVELDIYKLKKDYTTEIADKESKIETLSTEFKACGVELEMLTEQLNTLNNNIKEYNARIENVENIDIHAVERDIEKYTNQIKDIDTRLINVLSEKDKIEECISLLTGNLGAFNAQEIMDGMRQHQFLVSELANLKTTRQGVVVDLNKCEQSRERLNVHKYDPNCKYCVDNEFVKLAMRDITRIPELEKELNRIDGELADGSELLESVKNYNELHEQYKSVEHQIALARSNANTIKMTEDGLQSNKMSLTLLLKEAVSKRDRFVEIQEILKHNNVYKQKIEEITREVSTTTKKQYDLNSRYWALESELKKLAQDVEMLKSNERIYHNALNMQNVLNEYIALCNRNGVPYFIIKKYLPIIQHRTNEILSGVVPFTVRFTIGDSENIDMYIKYSDDNEWPIELTSGMESFVASLAIRTALLSITTLPKSLFIIIDEGFGVLDGDHWAPIHNMFVKMLSFCRVVLCISHIDSIKSMVDDIITIDRQGENSRLYVE